MAKLGSVKIHVDNENVGEGVRVTEYPVEKGEPFSDHVERTTPKLRFSAHLLGSDYSTRLNTLRNYMNKGTVVKYVGRTAASAVVITNIDRDYNAQIRNGIALTIDVQKIRITKSPWVKKKGQKPVSRGGKKKPTSKKPRPSPKVYHLTKKGDTYWDLARKYGTTVSKLRAFNKYPDRRIPIGVKLRIK
ncbi:LysM domain-containing protein [Exiguobacterium sp. s127]|uniref:LysM peptidoglycan-binding domain-containing protein n=1 Tax=Exiguobacterium sp. s127 TaxID=2751210 RepID=UPI001BEA0DCA|nr:LysM domain-containing protein [Exiguobacterium sp. s127]